MPGRAQVTQPSKSARRHTHADPAAPDKTILKAAAAQNAAVFQIVWTVWAGGRRFYVVFHMVRPHLFWLMMRHG